MISILTYHSIDTSGSVVSVSPHDFQTQMACLADRGYRGIALRNAVNHRMLHGDWPKKAVVLTFDDGFKNFYDTAMPVLLHHGFTATVFIVSGFMGRHNEWGPAPAGLGRREILTWEQATELAAGGIEIGSHTRTHRDLTRLSPQDIELEIVGSINEIQSRVTVPVESFAYPFGKISHTAIKCVTGAFHAGCTTQLQRANGGLLHTLPRIDMYYVRSQSQVERLLNGRLDWYLTIRAAGRSIRSAVFE
jgi:peptidoglycan/xylan/chitin deacetylase (PgdA/CDA1 family)